jgi:hypothetical protein
MAGRSHKVRSIQSYINHADTHSGLGPLKAGTPNKVGVTHYLWHNLQTQSNPGPLDKVFNQTYYNTKKYYMPMGFPTNIPASRYRSS